jgi:hypothetical protein
MGAIPVGKDGGCQKAPHYKALAAHEAAKVATDLELKIEVGDGCSITA